MLQNSVTAIRIMAEISDVANSGQINGRLSARFDTTENVAREAAAQDIKTTAVSVATCQ